MIVLRRCAEICRRCAESHRQMAGAMQMILIPLSLALLSRFCVFRGDRVHA